MNFSFYPWSPSMVRNFGLTNTMCSILWLLLLKRLELYFQSHKHNISM